MPGGPALSGTAGQAKEERRIGHRVSAAPRDLCVAPSEVWRFRGEASIQALRSDVGFQAVKKRFTCG
jgi:hypothetical protein